MLKRLVDGPHLRRLQQLFDYAETLGIHISIPGAVNPVRVSFIDHSGSVESEYSLLDAEDGMTYPSHSVSIPPEMEFKLVREVEDVEVPEAPTPEAPHAEGRKEQEGQTEG